MTKSNTVTTKVNETETKKKGWRIKEYYVDPKAFSAAQEELKKAPNQVQIMMKCFAEKFNKVELAAQGRVMCETAISEYGLKTVIEPNVLFAYYRRKMEEYGLKLK